ncbi:MAG: Fic family protein [Spirochaetaceae bacterium]|jgi:Fic family protein|nr:Fic family protein [Spirochaetaceae bacterium]
MDIFESKLDISFDLTQKALSLIAQIDQYRGFWAGRELQEGRALKELKTIATVQSIGSSTRIEGATMTDDEVSDLMRNVKITKMKTRDEQEVAGYYETLEIIYENYRTIRLSESYLQQLHGMLLKYSEKDDRHRGHYKQLSNQVVARYPDGSQQIIFKTTEPFLVESEIHSVLEWTNQKLSDGSIHALLVIALFVYEFLSIHPFQDGNGRLSRLLTTCCLLQQGYGFIQYISFENHIEEHKSEYYRVLMEGQRQRGKNTEKVGSWILFFLESLVALTKKLDDKYERLKQTSSYMNSRQRQVRDYIAAHQALKFADIAAHFIDIPTGTLKKDLTVLRAEKMLLTTGKGRGTVYGAAPTYPSV